MKFIFLAAGRGSRLAPITNKHPKCLTPFNGRPIIEYTIDVLKTFDVSELIVIGGYKSKILQKHLQDLNVSFNFIVNSNYENTNMVYSLFQAINEFNDDLIISYSDIIYRSKVLKTLINYKADIGTIIDLDWLSLWKIRMDNPLDDAETCKIDKNDNIIEIGNKPRALSDIQGQFIGLSKISKDYISTFIDEYKKIDKKISSKIHFTGFIQHLLNKKQKIKAIKINGGWIEIDSLEDLKRYKNSSAINKRLGLNFGEN